MSKENLSLDYGFGVPKEALNHLKTIQKEIEEAGGRLLNYSTNMLLSINIEVDSRKEFQKKYNKINTCKNFSSYSWQDPNDPIANMTYEEYCEKYGFL